MKKIDEIEVIDNIEMAVSILKNKKVLFSIITGIKNYFIYQKDKIIILNNNSSLTISIDKFKELYDGNKFYLYEENDEKFDFSRDDEYYGWKHK